MPCIDLESGSCKRQTSNAYCLALLSGMPQRRARDVDATQVDLLLVITREVLLLGSHGSIATLLATNVMLCCVQLIVLMDLNASHLVQRIDVSGIMYMCSCSCICSGRDIISVLVKSTCQLLLCVLQTVLASASADPEINANCIFSSGAVNALAATLQVVHFSCQKGSLRCEYLAGAWISN